MAIYFRIWKKYHVGLCHVPITRDIQLRNLSAIMQQAQLQEI
jgi:hypothetical protein